MRILSALLLASVCFGANELSNTRAPGFSLPDSSFKRWDLQDFRGKWLLLEFIQTDCPHCKALSKTLETIKQKHPGRVGVLTVVIAPPENMDTVAKYRKETGVTVPILFDQGQMAASYFQASPSKPFHFDTPHLFVVNPQGMIVRDYGHSSSNHEMLEGPALIKELDPLLNGK